MTQQEQITEQERIILTQRAELAELKTRIANLVKGLEGSQRYIGRLQDKLKRATRSEAERAFK